MAARVVMKQLVIAIDGYSSCGKSTTAKAVAAALHYAYVDTGAMYRVVALAAQRAFPGNRPSTTLLLERVNPRSLGALIALYEHRVFTSGALWGINSFDQWGVELGKSLSNRLLPMLQGQGAGTPEVSALDGSTAGLLARLGRA